MIKIKKEEMDIVFILDNSGSMGNCVDDTIEGFNSFVVKQKKKGKGLLTTILFNNIHKVLYERKPILSVDMMNADDYNTFGSTALYDAIGYSIKRLDIYAKNKKSMIFITTDGLENSSKEFSKSDIKKLIKEHKNWSFIFLGAGIDSYKEASDIGIRKEFVSNFSKSRGCLGSVFEACSCACDSFMSDGTVKKTWKKKLDNYLKKEIASKI